MTARPPTGPDHDVHHRRRAAAVAGHRNEVDTARRFLDDADASVRATALGALARAGGLTGEDLDRAIADVSPEVRVKVTELVADLQGRGPASDVALLGLLHDPDPAVVESTAWALGEREPPEPGSVEALAALATGADDSLVRESAVASLGSLGDPAGLGAILAATGDKATVRRRAVIALAPFEGDEVDAALRRALGDRDWQVRQAAEDLIVPEP